MSGAPLLATQNVTDLLSLTATRRQVPQRQTGDPVDIVKRDGRVERYDGEKIVSAVTRAFADGGAIAAREELAAILADVEARLEDGARVEEIQDLVEQALMRRGHFDAAKRYILYRHRRSELRAARDEVVREVAGDDAALASELSAVLSRARRDYPDEAYSLSALLARLRGFLKGGMRPDERLSALVRAAVELTSQEAPRWEMIAGRLLSLSARRSIADACARRGISGFADKVRHLTDEGLYGAYVLERYAPEELERAAELIRPERDDLLTYAGLDLLLKRYVIRSHDHVALESPQEMFLGIALHLAMEEPEDVRMTWVGRFYDALSTLRLTMATPTMGNARKPQHQLSSCFIDTVPDSLTGIYRSIDNFAQVSKYGGGMGMYLGKVRAQGGSIRGFAGVAGGTTRWIRVINDTAVAVDQLGMRQGAVAVYLDAWHRDLPEFLQLRTNNGDERMKAHDVFPAVC